MNISDLIRAMLIGQTVWTITWIAIIYTMIWRARVRPGVFIGISLVALGDFGAMLFVVISTLARFGDPPDYKTWLATLAIVTESLGCVLIAAHLFFHNDRLYSKVKSWFRNGDATK